MQPSTSSAPTFSSDSLMSSLTSSSNNIQNSNSSDSSLELKSTDRFSEKDVQDIVGLGFTRAQVMQALRSFNGDTTQATASLFAKSLKY